VITRSTTTLEDRAPRIAERPSQTIWILAKKPPGSKSRPGSPPAPATPCGSTPAAAPAVSCAAAPGAPRSNPPERPPSSLPKAHGTRRVPWRPGVIRTTRTPSFAAHGSHPPAPHQWPPCAPHA
jgi:hypothetical protein